MSGNVPRTDVGKAQMMRVSEKPAGGTAKQSVTNYPEFRGGLAGNNAVPSYYRSAWNGHKLGTNGVDSANRVHFVVRIRAALDRGHLSDALSHVVSHHDILQSELIERDGVPHIKAGAYRAAHLVHYSLARGEGKQAVVEARKLVSTLVWQRFVSNEGVYRAFLIRLAPKDYVFGFVLHHFVGDAFSIQLLFRQIQEAYFARTSGRRLTGARPAFQYGDYLAAMRQWRHCEVAEHSLEYWVNKVTKSHNLFGQEAARWDSAWVRRPLEIDARMTRRLRDLARCHRTTLFTVLVAVQMLLLSRISGHQNVAVAAVTSGRELPILRDVVGRFSDRLYYTANVENTVNFSQLVECVRDDARKAGAYPFIRFDLLQEILVQKEICVVAPIFNFRSIGKNVAAGTGNPWKAFAVDKPPGISRLGSSVHYYWMEMWDTQRTLQATLRCQETIADYLCEAIRDIVAAVAMSPGVPLSDLLACSAEKFSVFRELNLLARSAPLRQYGT